MVVKDTPSTHLCVSLSQQGRSIKGLLPSELDPLDNGRQKQEYVTSPITPHQGKLDRLIKHLG